MPRDATYMKLYYVNVHDCKRVDEVQSCLRKIVKYINLTCKLVKLDVPTGLVGITNTNSKCY